MYLAVVTATIVCLIYLLPTAFNSKTAQEPQIKRNELHMDDLGVCEKGQRGFKKQWMRQQFSEFIKVYNKRPRHVNEHGTRMTHQFAMWCTIR